MPRAKTVQEDKLEQKETSRFILIKGSINIVLLSLFHESTVKAEERQRSLGDRLNYLQARYFFEVSCFIFKFFFNLFFKFLIEKMI